VRQWIAQGRANAQSRILLKTRLTGISFRLAEFASRSASGSATPALPPPGTAQAAESSRERNTDACLSTPNRKLFQRGWDLVKIIFGSRSRDFPDPSNRRGVGSIPLVGLALTYIFYRRPRLDVFEACRGEKSGSGRCTFAGFNLAFGPVGIVQPCRSIAGFPRDHIFILPGIYLSISWMFFTPLIILDKRLDFGRRWNLVAGRDTALVASLCFASSACW